jgi:peptide/nickel transport system substrate-binding protein
MRLDTRILAVAAAAAFAVAAAQAQTVRIANQGDSLSLDPHSLNESLQLKDLSLVPALATSWKQTSPTVWRFELRKGVKFHDGTPFTADDVVFSLRRAADDGGDFKGVVGEIKEVRKVNDFTVDVETKAPFPILPDQISTTYIMSKKWCEDNQAAKPVDRRKGLENAASFRANGTGPYRVRERQPNVRTTFVRNGNYWGKIDGNVQEVIFTTTPRAWPRCCPARST